jgi:Kef-type K+ transport system membrane component KefB
MNIRPNLREYENNQSFKNFKLLGKLALTMSNPLTQRQKMHALSSHEVTVFLVVVGCMLILARLLFKIGRYFHIPQLVAELLAGIIMGPTVLGNVFPELHAICFPEGVGLAGAYDILFNLSVVMLLFLAGMELDFHLLTKSKKSIFITSALAIGFPLSVGVWAGWKYFSFFHGFVFSAAPFVFPLIFGTIVSLSALAILVRILMQYNILNSPIGITVVGTALVTDVVGWLLFSSILTYANPSLDNIQIIYTIFYIIIFFLSMFLFSSSKKFMAKIFSESDASKTEVSYDISMLFGICLLAGAFTNAINIHPSLGAFISGIVCRRIIGENPYLFEQLQMFIMNFFAPIFFISIGLKVNFFTELNIPMFLAIFVLACTMKLLGAVLGAYISGFSFRPALIIGAALNARGSMEIIMGAIAFKIGLIGSQLFVSFVLLAVITGSISGPILVKLLKGLPNPDS